MSQSLEQPISQSKLQADDELTDDRGQQGTEEDLSGGYRPQLQMIESSDSVAKPTASPISGPHAVCLLILAALCIWVSCYIPWYQWDYKERTQIAALKLKQKLSCIRTANTSLFFKNWCDQSIEQYQ